MDKEFTVQLAEPEAEYLNTIIPKNHSVQVYQKYERRKKAEKKLDDMYVAEFSLRPTKKLKRQAETIPDNNEKLALNNQKPNYQETRVTKNQSKKPHSKDLEAQLPKVQVQPQKESVEKEHRKNQIQVRQIRPSRSQRISKPTEAFKQFQQETFKRKIVEKQDEKAEPMVMNFLNQRQLKMQKRHQIEKMNQQQNDCESENIPVQTKQSEKKQQPNKKMEQMSEKKSNDSKEKHENKKIGIQVQFSGNLERQLQRKKQQTIQNQDHIELKEQNKNKLQTNVNAQNDCPKDCSMDCQEDCQKDCPKMKKQHQCQDKQFKQTNSRINLKRCHLILQKLRSHKSSWPFKHPVDPQKQGVPDYYEKIKHPMDLKTIQKKLKSLKYSSDDQFFSDIELMLKNSFDYNPVNTPVYKRTIQLQQAFQKYRNSDNLEKYETKKSSAGQNEQNSSYSEQDDDQQQKREKKVEKYEQKGQKASKQHQEHSQTTMQLRINRTPRIKIISVDEGISKKQKHRIEKLKFEENIICRTPTKQKHDEGQIQNKGSVEKLKQTKKQQKQRKTEQKKKSSDQVVRVSKEDNKKQVQVQKGSRQKLPFGYSQFKISVVQRETLLYDILHIQTPEIRNQISDFLQQNDEKFRIYKKNLQEQDSDYYDFNLGDLDMNSYIMLRKEVDRLMRLQDELKKSMEITTQKAEITQSDIRKDNAQ